MTEERRKKDARQKRTRGVRNIREALDLFFTRHPGRANFRLAYLWENWGLVMGEHLGRCALPLGALGRTLLVGAEDNLLLHELSFHTPDILSRANAFMDEEYFDKVRLEPLRGRAQLYPPGRDASVAARTAWEESPADERPRPDGLGGLLGRLDPDSPLGRAYASYVKSFEERQRPGESGPGRDSF